MKASSRMKLAGAAALPGALAGQSGHSVVVAEREFGVVKPGVNPAKPAPGQSVSALERLFGITATAGEVPWRPTYIKRPRGSVARDKRLARKARGIQRHRRATRG